MDHHLASDQLVRPSGALTTRARHRLALDSDAIGTRGRHDCPPRTPARVLPSPSREGRKTTTMNNSESIPTEHPDHTSMPDDECNAVEVIDVATYPTAHAACSAFARTAACFGGTAPEALLGLVHRLAADDFDIESLVDDANGLALEQASERGGQVPAEITMREYMLEPGTTNVISDYDANVDGPHECCWFFGSGTTVATLSMRWGVNGLVTYDVGVGYHVAKIGSLADLESAVQSMRIRVDARDTVPNHVN